MGVSVVVVVVVAMLAAVTLLPGSARLGRHEDRQALDPPQGARDASPPTRRSPAAGRITSAVTRCATRSAASWRSARSRCPALSLRIGTADDGNAAAHTTQRKAYDALADGFGRGFNGPIQVVVDVPTPADRVAVTRVHDALQADRRRRRRHRTRVQRRRRHRGDDRRPDDRAARRARPTPSCGTSGPTCSRHGAGHQRQGAAHRASLGHRPHRSASPTGCRSSSPRWWRCRSCC